LPEIALDSLISAWSRLDTRRRIIVTLATVAVFAAVLALSRGAGSSSMLLLYAGLEVEAAGDVVSALEQRGIAYEVRGDAIYVPDGQRDVLRMTLASEGLPASNGQGYELLDNLSGFGTTSQMFDAAYWRAKEGELARTILASPHIRSARVHISSPSNRPFQREDRQTAAVTVTTTGGSLSGPHAKALRYLVASAVSGLSPDDVAVIDGDGGLIGGPDETGAGGDTRARANELRARAERLLEARVGYGNVVVELSVEAVTETESIVERVFDPEGRVAISTEVEERSNTSQDSQNGTVTVASNLPDGDAAGGEGASSAETSESRQLTNFEVSETQREILRAPGAVRRLTVAVLVNDVTTVDATGIATVTPRTEEELSAMRDLVASAVGYDEARGDVITIKSMGFEPIAPLGTEGIATSSLPIDMMSLIQLGFLAVVALILGLFVVRPILTSGRPRASLAPPAAYSALTGDVQNPVTSGSQATLATNAITMSGGIAGTAEGADPVTRLRKMIEERQEESLQILQSWIEEPEEAGRV